MKPSKLFILLRDFLTNRMKMSHIYQPVMLMEIIKRGGTASVEEIAKSLLEHDQSQIDYYSEITKKMVGDVLSSKNGIVQKLKTGNSIHGYAIPDFDELSSEEISDLISICQSKVNDYVDLRGNRIWSHRQKSSGYISGTVQYEVLTRAKFRCELCGTLDGDKALQVDHIVPRNHGGSDDISNLQALCYSCNAMKRDRDDTDFRGVAQSYEDRSQGCLFCEIEPSRIIDQNALCYSIRDAFPVTDLHTLIIPKRHVSEFFDLYQPEINSINDLLKTTKVKLQEIDPSICGFNIGVNVGASAGQTIFHCHVHLIPRRTGDVADPRGGVRGVISEKQSY
jgi:ATP adenylyltransferase